MVGFHIKEIELWARRLYLRSTERPFHGELIDTPHKVFDTDSPRILLLRQDRIGDVICSTPIIATLRNTFPNAQVDIVLSRNNISLSPLVRHWCDHIWRYDKTVLSLYKLRRSLRRARYDVVVDLMDNPSTTSTMFLRATAAPYRIGILKQNAWAYTHCVPLLDRSRYHYVDRIAQLLLPFGIDPSACSLELIYPLSAIDIAQAACDLDLATYPERCGFIFVHTSTRHEPLRWEWHRYVELVQNLRRSFPSFAIGLGGMHNDEAIVRQVAMQSGAFVLPFVPFHRYAAMLHFARLLISPDTSIVHIAAARKVPAVVLYHRGDEGLLPWYPYRSPYRALVAQGSINAIDVGDVTTAAVELLTENSPSTGERIFVSL